MIDWASQSFTNAKHQDILFHLYGDRSCQQEEIFTNLRVHFRQELHRVNCSFPTKQKEISIVCIK